MRSAINLEHLESSNLGADRLYGEYVARLERDISDFFSDRSRLQNVACPGCGAGVALPVYEKLGLTYEKCTACGSIFVNPRPQADFLDIFYEKSSACRYWRSEVQNLSETHLNHLHGPNIQWLSELVDERFDTTPTLLDYGSSSPYFLARLVATFTSSEIISFRPQLYECQGLSPKGIHFWSSWEDLSTKADIISAFHSVERMVDCGKFMQWAGKNCRKDGFLLLTTTTCSGFEYQVLGKYASTLNPINRMNLLSLEALTGLIVGAGFEIVELSTPGRLDVEIVRTTLDRMGDGIIEPFWEYLFRHRDEHTWNNLQTFLQMNRLSSYVRIAAIRK
ncbi:MAG: methyltransferase domain-containing protein [Magnetococcales bacterium]|nr:methyltransferase domain-containing protein [Magnetococcales bacterium]